MNRKPGSLLSVVRALLESFPGLGNEEIYTIVRPTFHRENPTWLRNRISRYRAALKKGPRHD